MFCSCGREITHVALPETTPDEWLEDDELRRREERAVARALGDFVCAGCGYAWHYIGEEN